MPKDKERPPGQTGAVMKPPQAYPLVITVALLLCALHAPAQDMSPVRPQDYVPVQRLKELPQRTPADLPEPIIDVPDDDTVLADALEAVVFLADPSALVFEGAQGEGVVVRDVELLDNDEFRALIEPHIGRPITWQQIRKILETTILYYRRHDRPIVDVIPPEQDVTNGVLQILIVEGRLGQITVEGNKWFTDSQISENVRLEQGDVISVSRLLGDIDFINRNPFRYVRPVLAPGGELGATDLVLQTEDRIPYRFYIGYEDTGSRETELGRYLVGVNMGNLFNRGIEFGYQFATNHSMNT